LQGTAGITGVQGAQGFQGDVGNDGVQGNQGYQGIEGIGTQGFQGDVGEQGLQGPLSQGPQGPEGIQGLPGGAQGFQGPIGPQGNQGFVGTQGSQGITGTQGPQGLQGNIGLQGNQGLVGPQGFQGNIGLQGNQGFVGAQGNQGITGVQGAQGFQGNEGQGGVQGNQGIEGIGTQGFQGDVGEQGLQGPLSQGPQGPEGIQGLPGGAQGFQGTVGPQGNDGIQGVEGAAGAQGSQGITGVQGPQGFQGIEGFGLQGLQGLQGEGGPQGLQGSGIQGFQGNAGAQGPVGPLGGPGITFKSFSLQTDNSGSDFIAGYYDFSATDANLTQAATSVVFGTASVSYAAHASIVAGGAGSVDTGQVGLRVTGTSINDNGVRTTSDSETITTDITTLSLNQYLETDKKWLGQITFELFVVSGSPTTYSLDFNYGLSKYEDFGNNEFTVQHFEVVGLSGGNDSDFDVTLYHHNSSGWTYAATGFVPGGDVIVDLDTDHSTDDSISNGEYFAYKRANLAQFVDGSGSEGIVIRVSTTIGQAVEYLDAHVGVLGLSSQGVQGVQGYQGPVGLQGVQGNDGPQGLEGLQGPQGLVGLQGAQGFQGNAGAAGAAGAQGNQGFQGAINLIRYSAGSGATVVASDTGVTFSKAAGVGTLTIPTGVEVFSVIINGVTADLDASDNFTVRVTFSGSEWNNTDADTLFPKAMVMDRTTVGFGGPTTGLPYNLRDAGDAGISIQVTALGSGSMDVLFLSLNGFSTWSLLLDF
jgi:hypothetical protein